MNISIFGYGRMGKIIDEIAKQRGHSIISVSNSKNPAIGLDISNADVVIDFSLPSTAYKNICYAFLCDARDDDDDAVRCSCQKCVRVCEL